MDSMLLVLTFQLSSVKNRCNHFTFSLVIKFLHYLHILCSLILLHAILHLTYSLVLSLAFHSKYRQFSVFPSAILPGSDFQLIFFSYVMLSLLVFLPPQFTILGFSSATIPFSIFAFCDRHFCMGAALWSTGVGFGVGEVILALWVGDTSNRSKNKIATSLYISHGQH